MLDSYVKHKVGKEEGLQSWVEFCDVGNKEKAISSFEIHNAFVTDLIPDDQLLVFETGKNAYSDLAGFLNVSRPDSPYPHVNSTKEFAQLKLAFSAAAVFVVVIGSLGAYFLTRMLMKKIVLKKGVMND